MKKTYIFLVIALVIAVLTVSAVNKESKIQEPTSVKIVASFYPLAEFAKQIGAEKAEVLNMTPPGIDSHDFEPAARDIASAYSADIFLFNGSGLDPWAEKIAPDLKSRGVKVVHMAQYFELMKDPDGDHDDPHTWLDPVLAKEKVKIIRDALTDVDPENAAAYGMNAEAYLAELSALDRDYKEGLASCKIRDIIVSHDAFGYLAKRYDLNVESISGISPEEEPSPRRLAEIAEFVREKEIGYIFFEALLPADFAETIARETGAGTLPLDPVEALTDEDLAQGRNYVSIMRDNLFNLRRALECQ